MVTRGPYYFAYVMIISQQFPRLSWWLKRYRKQFSVQNLNHKKMKPCQQVVAFFRDHTGNISLIEN